MFFPDDDLLVAPGALQAMLRIYDRDTDGTIGGVCSAEATVAPIELQNVTRSTYQMTIYDRFKAKVGARHTAFERQFFPDPLVTYGRSRWGVQPKPTWLEDENAVLVEYMTGFRMSFRTNVIRASGFDETLGGYALCEDVDASFQVLKTHLLVGARNAKIFHYKVPTSRGSGRVLGAMHILNRAYVLKRHVASYNAFPVQELRRFNVYKLMQYVDPASDRNMVGSA